MNQNNGSEKRTGEIHPEQQDEVCLMYEGSYTKVYLMLLITIPALIFILCISEEAASRRMGSKYWLFEIAQILSYFSFPFVIYTILELGLYIINGIKANVVFCKDHFEVNSNRFGLLNYKINYTDIEMIEDFKMSGTSGFAIYLKYPSSDTYISEFRPNSLLAPVNKMIRKLFIKKYNVAVTTSEFDKKTYEKIYVELLRRLMALQEPETPDEPSTAV